MMILSVMVLVILTCCTTRGKYESMRRGLDSINQCNRSDLSFSVQDVKPYVNFFDKHGKPNDQLLAHYLLGRAYYESHEAPMALQCYHEAIECADTAQKDCDFKQLSRVYAQMAQIFYDQGLYRQQLESDKQAEEFAWIAKDTLAALISNEKQGVAYSEIKMLDSAVCVIDNVASKFSQYGYTTHATISLGNILHILINLGEYEKARRYISIYESRSGYINKNKDAIEGKEFYYYCKGRLSIVSTQLDSAEYWFRKELEYGKDFNNQNAGALGLAMVYEQRHIPDSAAKYYHYAYAMNDSMHAQKATEEVERMQAMYDYARYQEEAYKEKEKATQANRKLLVCFIILLVISLIASWLYIARKNVIENLKQMSSELTSTREELAILQQNSFSNKNTITEKETRIKQLEQKLGKYGKLVYFGAEKAENDLLLSSKYQIIRSMAYKGQTFQENDWIIIQQLICEYFPGFDDFLHSKLKIESVEYKVSMLLRMHLKAGEIANVLSVTPPYISKISTAILANLFNKRGSSKDLAKEFSKII